MANGGNARDCHYSLDGDDLTIDASAGRSCIEQLKMALHFKRVHYPIMLTAKRSRRAMPRVSACEVNQPAIGTSAFGPFRDVRVD